MKLALGFVRGLSLYAVWCFLAVLVLIGFAAVVIPALRGFMGVTGFGGLATFAVLTLALLLAISLRTRRAA